jgi:uncharacterized protein YoxC
MTTRRELIEQLQKIANTPAENLQGLTKQAAMLASITLALDKHYRKKEEVLDLLVKKTKELVGVVNSVRGSQKRVSTRLESATDTSEIMATVRLKPIEAPKSS